MCVCSSTHPKKYVPWTGEAFTQALSGRCYIARVGEECTEEVRDLIDVCMRTNVNERPSAMDIVQKLQVTSPSAISPLRHSSCTPIHLPASFLHTTRSMPLST